MDYSIYDALQAGFDKVVFIIRKDLEKDFREIIGNRIEKVTKVEYAFQELDNLPEGFEKPADRKKPWGTGQAVLSVKGLVNGPFMVINADDYYGQNAFFEIGKHLSIAKPGQYAMTAYSLEKTVSQNGTVSRGVCEIENGMLKKVTEFTKINSNCEYEASGAWKAHAKDTPVSMNLWGLTPDIFGHIEREYQKFLKTANLQKDEFFIPSVISKVIDDGMGTVQVFKNTDKWYGITYREDLGEIKEAIGGYIVDGLYPGI